jgi:antitoxin CcdA
VSKDYRNVMEPRLVLDGVTCNKCRKYFSKARYPDEVKEFLSWESNTGWGSVFGDLCMVELDLCQHCVKKVLGPYLRIARLGGDKVKCES